MTNRVALKEVLRQYRITHWVRNDETYRQVTVSQTGEVSFRGEKLGEYIGRKRQFIIDLDKHPNTLVFIRQGVFKGGIGIAPPEVNKSIVTENMPLFDIVGIKPRYLSLYLKSSQFKSAVNRLVPLGTAQKAIHEKQLLQLEMPLPPEEEQDKVIFKLNDIIEKKEQLSLKSRKNIELISTLRHAILQEAVSGKLVLQDPNDEPASELLKKIKDEKNRPIVEKKIKEERLMPPITQEELPFDLPSGWAWVRFGDLIESMKNGLYKPSKFYGSGIPCLRMYNIDEGKIVLKNIREMILSESEINEYGLQENDILLNRINSRELVGKAAVVPKGLGKIVFEAMNIRIRVRKGFVIPQYICYFLLTQYVRDQIESTCKQTVGQATVSQEDIRKWLIPYANIQEQQRIVQKIDALMRLCDELEQKVNENQQNLEFFMEAVLGKAFAS